MSTTEQHAADPRRPRPEAGLALPALLLWVAAAGALGAFLRLSITEPMEEHFMKFPWATLLINVLGSAALGVLVGISHAWPRLPRWAVPVLGTGFLGSFTTFSLVVVLATASQHPDLFSQVAGDDVLPPGLWEMLAYLGMSVLFCTSAAAAGLTIGRAIFGCSGLACPHSEEPPR